MTLGDKLYSAWQKLSQRLACKLFRHTCTAIICVLALYFIRDHALWTARPKDRTLFLVTHSATDEEYTDNLKFLIKHGMGGQDEGLQEYIIIVQQLLEDDSHGEPWWTSLPTLPQSARYVQHKNLCFDWGTFGWALFNLDLDIKKYTYFVFMNTSVRGPYLPGYHDMNNNHWSQLFTSRITNKVKLVGSTISCEAAYEGGLSTGEIRHNPHVQSYLVATDQVGLQVLTEDEHIFKCHKDISDAVFNAEVGSSLAVFRAGYTIDSLMLRYQGVDWTDPANWQCNDNLNPYADFAYDGLLLNPLEVVFVKVKRFQQEGNWGSTRLATAYGGWMDQERIPGAVNSNQLMVNKLGLRLGRVLEMMLRGPACFDFDTYLKANPDLTALPSREHLWLRFVLEDQFTGRKFRFQCQNALERPGVAADVVRWQYNLVRGHTNPDFFNK